MRLDPKVTQSLAKVNYKAYLERGGQSDEDYSDQIRKKAERRQD